MFLASWFYDILVSAIDIVNVITLSKLQYYILCIMFLRISESDLAKRCMDYKVEGC